MVVERPKALYIKRLEDLRSMLGQPTCKNRLYPMNASIRIDMGNRITGGRLEERKRLHVEVENLRNSP